MACLKWKIPDKFQQAVYNCKILEGDEKNEK